MIECKRQAETVGRLSMSQLQSPRFDSELRVAVYVKFCMLSLVCWIAPGLNVWTEVPSVGRIDQDKAVAKN